MYASTSSGDYMHTIDTYLAWAATGWSDQTLRLRTYQLRAFAETHNPGEVTEDDLVAYLASGGWSASTRRSVRSALCGYFEWAHKRGHVTHNPAADLPTVPRPNYIPKPVPREVLDGALAKADDETRLMLLCGSLAGMRRGEIAAMHSDDINDLTITIRGKGDKVRNVPLHPRLKAALKGREGWIFPGRFGGPVFHDYVNQRVSRVLPEPWTTHSLRHRAATDWYRATGDITVVQLLLGHAKPETTMAYVLVDQDRLRDAVLAIP